MANELRAIAIAMNWVQRQGINLDQRIESVVLLAPEELVSLSSGSVRKHIARGFSPST